MIVNSGKTCDTKNGILKELETKSLRQCKFNSGIP